MQSDKAKADTPNIRKTGDRMNSKGTHCDKSVLKFRNIQLIIACIRVYCIFLSGKQSTPAVSNTANAKDLEIPSMSGEKNDIIF